MPRIYQVPVCTLTNSSNWIHAISVHAIADNIPLSLFVDTGASVSIIRTHAFQKLRTSKRQVTILEQPGLNLCGVNGTKFTVHCKVTLDICLTHRRPPISVTTYVAGVNFPADLLIGLPVLKQNHIDASPARYGIIFSGNFIAAMTYPAPIMVNDSHVAEQSNSVNTLTSNVRVSSAQSNSGVSHDVPVASVNSYVNTVHMTSTQSAEEISSIPEQPSAASENDNSRRHPEKRSA